MQFQIATIIRTGNTQYRYDVRVVELELKTDNRQRTTQKSQKSIKGLQAYHFSSPLHVPRVCNIKT